MNLMHSFYIQSEMALLQNVWDQNEAFSPFLPILLGVIECLITFASSLLLSFAENYGEDPNGLVFPFLLFHNLLELKFA